MNFLKILAILNGLIFLAIINFQIYSKEKTLKEGELVLLKLAPVDPRSLLQGDYMRLSYAITRDSLGFFFDTITKLPNRGYFVVKLDKNRVAQRVRVQPNAQPLKADEYLIRYYRNDWEIRLGAESYFFQEGTSKKFEQATYGGLRLAKDGESLLTGLYNKDFKLINR